MARCAVKVLFLARVSSMILAIFALKAFAYDDDPSFGIHATTIGQSTVALFGLIFGYAALLLVQGVGVAVGLAIPLPDVPALCAAIICFDMALALGTFGTSCGTIAIIMHARQNHIFVYAITLRYMTHGILGLVSGAMGIVAAYTQIWLAATFWPLHLEP